MNLKNLENMASALPLSEKMPALFLGHGSPMNAIEDNQFVRSFREISQKIPKPSAILCISAHWYTDGTFVTSGETQKTIHDFYGFPRELYKVEYPAKGSPTLASETAKLLLPNEVHETEEWGLDHGAWSVLKHLYPEAEIPVIQLSVNASKSPQWHFELAKSLKKLRERGVLVIGSGNIIHNLRLADFRNVNTVGFGYEWALEAQARINGWLESGDFQNVVQFQNGPQAVKIAAPTPDHFLPLLYTLGLKEDSEGLDIFNDELIAGSLSMTSVMVG